MSITPLRCEQPACLPKVEPCAAVPPEGSNRGELSGNRGELCGSQDKDGMENVAHKKCAKPGCDALTSRVVESASETSACVRHAKHGCDDESCTGAPTKVVKNAEFCLLHIQDGALSARSCLQPGCSRHPVPDLDGGGRAVLCAMHSEDRTANVAVRKCPEPGCRKHRNFGTLAVNLAEFCRQHAREGMLDLRIKRCSHAGCTVPAECGVKGTRKLEFCLKHSKKGLVKLRCKRPCAEAGCDVGPTYALEGSTRPEFCARHAKMGMVNVRSRKCAYQGCTKQPRFGPNGSRTLEFCGPHAPEGMVVIHPRRCHQPDCKGKGTHAAFGRKIGKFCAQHALDGMVNVTTPTTTIAATTAAATAAATTATATVTATTTTTATLTTTATTLTATGRITNNCAKVGNLTQVLYEVGDDREPEPSAWRVKGEAATDRDGGADYVNPGARIHSPPLVSVDLKQDAAGKQAIAGLRKRRRELEDDDAGAAPNECPPGWRMSGVLHLSGGR